MPKNTILIELNGISDGSTNIDLLSDLIPAEKLLALQAVSASNLTSASTTVTIGLKSGTDVSWIETIALTSAGLYYVTTITVYVTGNRKLIARFKSTNSGDKLRVYAYGYYA